MKKFFKKFFHKIAVFFSKYDNLHFCLCLLFLLIIFLGSHFNSGASIWKLLDREVLISVVVAFLISSAATLLGRFIADMLEDCTKLTDDYNSLVTKYSGNTDCLKHTNTNNIYAKKVVNTRKKEEQTDTYTLAVGDVLPLRKKTVTITDFPLSKYTAPEFCSEHYCELLKAHNASTVFNQTTLRVLNLEEDRDQVKISFGRSTYFDALVSNRVMDFKIDGLSVRDLYAHGPFLPPLEEKSLLSNHIGANGMIETNDGKFLFVIRGKKVSIGKSTIQCSIAASLKAKYALDRQQRLTKEGIAYAIMAEVWDELALSEVKCLTKTVPDGFPGFSNTSDVLSFCQKLLNGFSFDNNVWYFYRDLVEGGKPQFMFYAKINLSFDQISSAYKKKAKKNGLLQDGNEIIGISRAELEKVYLTTDKMVINDQVYSAMPSAIATVALLKTQFCVQDYIAAYRLCPENLFEDWESFVDLLYSNGGRVSYILWFEHVAITQRAASIGYGGYPDQKNSGYMYAETDLQQTQMEGMTLSQVKEYIHATMAAHPNQKLLPCFFHIL